MLFLLFQLGTDRYALPVQHVREVLPLVELKKIPQAPPGVAGVFNYRGAPTPVLDLSEFALGRPARSSLSTRIVLVNYRGEVLGIIAEQATETIRLDEADFVEAGVTVDGAPYLGAVATDARGVIQRIEVDQLLPASVRELLFREEAAIQIIPFPDIERMLQQTIGLNPSSIGSPAIARAAQARMHRQGVASPDDYWLLLQRSPDEMQELIETVVVSETWFFRDKEPFYTLSQTVKSQWRPAQAGTVLRILSVPCATGEEPYSIAMALMDAGLSANRFRIDAMDISLRVLEHGRRGVYGRNAFRGDDLNFRDRYFCRVEEGHRISEIVRECVDFRQGNLLAHNFASAEGPYDFIFCRNVLIYFDEEAQQRAVAALKRLLTPDGLLFVGHAEIPLLTSRGFAYSDPPSAFACRKESAVRRAPQQRPRRARIAPPAPRPTPPPVKLQRLAAALPDAAAPAEKKSSLEAIFQLADRGRLDEAAGLCIAHLKEHGDSAHAHYLLGLTRDATGDETRAAEHYRKALYLDPNHCEALAHLALLLEKRGDDTAARRLNARASRARKDSPMTA